jgi:peptidylglycine monooxygenase
VAVGDRENDRVQVFSPEGEFLAAWYDFYHPMDIVQGADGLVYVSDQIPRVSALTPEGELVDRCRPVLNGAHGLWIDPMGRFYLAEMIPSRVTRLSPA